MAFESRQHLLEIRQHQQVQYQKPFDGKHLKLLCIWVINIESTTNFLFKLVSDTAITEQVVQGNHISTQKENQGTKKM